MEDASVEGIVASDPSEQDSMVDFSNEEDKMAEEEDKVAEEDILEVASVAAIVASDPSEQDLMELKLTTAVT